MCSSSSSSSAPEDLRFGRTETHLPNRAVKKLANCSSHQEDCDNDDDDYYEDDLFGACSFPPADVDRGVVETQG